MTIDPTKFEAQGKPTVEQIRVIWDDLGRPGHRKVHAEVVKRGFQISERTIARWLELGLRAERPFGTKPLHEQGKVAGVERIVKQELAKLPQADIHKAEDMKRDGIEQVLGADMAGPSAGARAHAAITDEVTIIDKRIQELVGQSEAQLDVAEQKSRKILNIVLAEAAARRAHVMVLIPKETGAFVQAMTEASKQTLTGGLDQTPKAGDPKTIDGSFTTIEPESETELQAEIRKYLHDEEIA